MKKGRPAHVVSALADPALATTIGRVLTAETGSLGHRATTWHRWPAPRRFAEVDVEGHRIRMKIAVGRAKVEHDDAAAAARATGLPLREIVARAEAAWRAAGPGGGDGQTS